MKLYHAPEACSTASRIVLEEAGVIAVDLKSKTHVSDGLVGVDKPIPPIYHGPAAPKVGLRALRAASP